MSLQLLLLVLMGYLVGVTSSNVIHSILSHIPYCPTGCACSKDYRVDCSYLGLKSVPRVPPKTRILLLNGNSITQITHKDVSRMENLEELYLHSNRIHDITDVELKLFSQLRLLDLSDNPWHCGCNLKSKLNNNMLANVQLLNLESTMCNFPDHLQGRLISALKSKVENCEHGKHRRNARRSEFCKSNPCRHGGTCLSSSGQSGWCLCPMGYGGQFCEWHEGNLLHLTVSEVTGYCIKLQWTINVTNVRDFRIEYTEQPAQPSMPDNQQWLNGTIRQYAITDVKPDTLYRICVAAYAYYAYKRSPGYFIEEVCLYQMTDPLPSTVGNTRSHRPPTPLFPTNPDNYSSNQTATQLVMTIFGIILSISTVLILAVAALYISRRRGIRLLPRRRRQSPPNIVQIANPTYGSTGSPTPSVQDVPTEDNARINQDNDVPFILVTSESNEDVAEQAGPGSGGEATCMYADTVSVASSRDSSTASTKDQTCGTDKIEDLAKREDGDGDSYHGEDFENGHLIKDGNSIHGEDTENGHLIRDGNSIHGEDFENGHLIKDENSYHGEDFENGHFIEDSDSVRSAKDIIQC